VDKFLAQPVQRLTFLASASASVLQKHQNIYSFETCNIGKIQQQHLHFIKVANFKNYSKFTCAKIKLTVDILNMHRTNVKKPFVSAMLTAWPGGLGLELPNVRSD